jgi:hypothetical protein
MVRDSRIGSFAVGERMIAIRKFPTYASIRKNRALAGPVEFAGVGAPTITFQRGTAACIAVADLGGYGNLLPRSI